MEGTIAGVGLNQRQSAAKVLHFCADCLFMLSLSWGLSTWQEGMGGKNILNIRSGF